MCQYIPTPHVMAYLWQVSNVMMPNEMLDLFIYLFIVYGIMGSRANAVLQTNTQILFILCTGEKTNTVVSSSVVCYTVWHRSLEDCNSTSRSTCTAVLSVLRRYQWTYINIAL